MKMSFHSHADKTHFHMKSFARGLALKKRHKTTRKWPTLQSVSSTGKVSNLGQSQWHLIGRLRPGPNTNQALRESTSKLSLLFHHSRALSESSNLLLLESLNWNSRFRLFSDSLVFSSNVLRSGRVELV